MNYKRLALALAGLALAQQTATADSITFSHVLAANPVPAQGSSSGNNFHVSGQYTYGTGWTLGSQFDSSLGQLDRMDWSVSFTASLPTRFTYLQPPGSAGEGFVSESWTAQYLRIGSLGLDGRYLFTTSGLPTDSASLNVPVGGSATANLLMNGTVTAHVTDPVLLNDFIVGATFYVDTLLRYDFSATYANGGAGPANVQGQLTYTYHYTPAPVPMPEPSVSALAAGAGAGLLALRRRRGADR